MGRNQIDGQISMFDVELPPPTRVSPAHVPDDEYTLTNFPKDIPTVNEILKLLEKGMYKVNAHEFLSDVFECSAIAISNKFDMRQADEREKRYLQIIKKYTPDMQNLLAEVFAKIFVLLSNQVNPAVGFADYLGELYMRSDTSNSKAGQFFTPYCVSKMCAECSIDPHRVEQAIENDEVLTFSEPACGSGGMIIAAADTLYYKYQFNYSRNMLVECSDIDSRCVHMCYLQLSLAGIPAIIFRRNTITMETRDRWETPTYIMQWTRFRHFLGGVNDCNPERGLSGAS